MVVDLGLVVGVVLAGPTDVGGVCAGSGAGRVGTVVVEPGAMRLAAGSSRPGNEEGVTKSPESTPLATADMNRAKIVVGNEPPFTLATPCTPSNGFDCPDG